MTREERLAFCQVCTKRKMDWNKGLLCGLTGEAATFEGNCDSFDVDEEELEYVKQRQAAVDESQIGDPKDFRKNKSRGALIFSAGSLVAIIGFIGAQVGDGGGYVILPLGVVIYGGLMYLRGVQQEKEYNQKNAKE